LWRGYLPGQAARMHVLLERFLLSAAHVALELLEFSHTLQLVLLRVRIQTLHGPASVRQLSCARMIGADPAPAENTMHTTARHRSRGGTLSSVCPPRRQQTAKPTENKETGREQTRQKTEDRHDVCSM